MAKFSKFCCLRWRTPFPNSGTHIEMLHQCSGIVRTSGRSHIACNILPVHWGYIEATKQDRRQEIQHQQMIKPTRSVLFFCDNVVCVFLWAADRECDVWVKEANSNSGKVMLQYRLCRSSDTIDNFQVYRKREEGHP